MKEPLLQKFKHLMHISSQEKRENPRHSIAMNIRYRTPKMASYEEGILCDVSLNGLMLKTQKPLKRKTRIHMVVSSSDQSQRPIHIVASVVRQASELSDCEYTYGCVIEELHDTN